MARRRMPSPTVAEMMIAAATASRLPRLTLAILSASCEATLSTASGRRRRGLDMMGCECAG